MPRATKTTTTRTTRAALIREHTADTTPVTKTKTGPVEPAWAEAARQLAVTVDAEGPDCRDDRRAVSQPSAETRILLARLIDEFLAWGGFPRIEGPNAATRKRAAERAHCLDGLLQVVQVERLAVLDGPVREGTTELSADEVMGLIDGLRDAAAGRIVPVPRDQPLIDALEGLRQTIQRLADELTGRAVEANEAVTVSASWAVEARVLVDAYDLQVANGRPRRGKRELLEAFGRLTEQERLDAVRLARQADRAEGIPVNEGGRR